MARRRARGHDDGVNWPYYDTIGTPQSNAVEITERFALSGDQTRLDFLITVRDPPLSPLQR
jgi:hypothetical protein